jgi:hypothetical protein
MRFRISRNTEIKNRLDIEYTKIAVLTSKLQIEEIVFPAGSGFLFGTAAEYAVKKLMKIATVVIGLLVAVSGGSGNGSGGGSGPSQPTTMS